MAQVRWSDLDSNTYERMVAVLLSTLHPNAERIDGAGGDGGRDVQLREDGRKDFFELKSHTGRLAIASGPRSSARWLGRPSTTPTAGPWSSRSTTPGS